jgi:hypothetical protein
VRRVVAGVMWVLVGLVSVADATAAERTPSQFTGPSPFAPNCNGAPQTGTVNPNAEVEPWVDANPRDPRHLVAVWQQDRWSNGGAQGNLTSISFDRGRTWQRPTPPPFSRCPGGNAATGGDYERASDPWVSFAPNGIVHQIALAENDSDPTDAMLVSRSRDGGRTWDRITTLQRDTAAELSNDKETITADPTNARFVYAVWDRLRFGPEGAFSGDTLFARSTDGGRTWEPTRTILDFPDNSGEQSLGNQIVVLPDGTLVNVFLFFDDPDGFVAVQCSTNKGLTWSAPIVIDTFLSSFLLGGAVVDPADGTRVRTMDVSPEIAVDPRSGRRALHVVWQDTRFSGGALRDQVVLATSTDGGLTWSAPKRVSENPDVQAFTPSVEVATNGTVGLSYYDFTFDDPTGGTLDTDQWIAFSTDAGASFGRRQRVTPRSFDMRTAPFANGFFVGDYEGLIESDGRFVSAYVAANNGNLANRTDGFATVVAPPLSTLPQVGIAASRAKTPRVGAGQRPTKRGALRRR